ncbi:hypothetical protein RDI58_008722 [Solanum bulbocastanum]|uniref:Uncharacterized protein n=1 Tax=Solanum bulbocastanum TaxID=147425 RepID=A0AAN8TY28_SOLBU
MMTSQFRERALIPVKNVEHCSYQSDL